jgi:hypothetical protein
MSDLTVPETDLRSIESIRALGFIGFESVASLWNDKSPIPKQIGVYLVINPDCHNPRFICPGVGGFFKGRDPNVSLEELKLNFLRGALVVYVGKAGSPAQASTLHSRLGEYLRFGQGKNVGHSGGRYIWQLANHVDLLVCWKPTPNDDPRQIEKQLIADFQKQFGKRPFANLAS